jgi:hypothetical protein
MGVDIKVIATGVVALCLVLSAMLSISGAMYPLLREAADRFFLLGVLLIAIVIVLALAGIKLKLP